MHFYKDFQLILQWRFNVLWRCCNEFQYTRKMPHHSIYSVFFEWIEGQGLSPFIMNSFKKTLKKVPIRHVLTSIFVSFPASIFEAFCDDFKAEKHPRKRPLFTTEFKITFWAHFHAKKLPKSGLRQPWRPSKTQWISLVKRDAVFWWFLERFWLPKRSKSAT